MQAHFCNNLEIYIVNAYPIKLQSISDVGLFIPTGSSNSSWILYRITNMVVDNKET